MSQSCSLRQVFLDVDVNGVARPKAGNVDYGRLIFGAGEMEARRRAQCRNFPEVGP